MRKFGLIGKSLGHSFSKKYFTGKFAREKINASYELFELGDISQIKQLFNDESLMGINVTIPYKESIIRFLDKLSDEAQKIGAVNIVKKENEILVGYNTDYYGFNASLLHFIDNEKPNALILGSGGASKAVQQVIEDLKMNYNVVSRNDRYDFSYKSLTRKIVETHKLIINTTPLGMFPNINTFPELPYETIDDTYYCFDLVYNPECTLFLKKCEKQGAKIKNGLEMLHFQAEEAWKIWNF